ncbi:molybdopterin-dependent oxidoreductase [Cocleimonas sp. KMM 6892]|uniref:molybdopterin-dependent oxidoreductase n=1 Tax=unclassified Cocleimonas TaxID=2639732 RepID=UPI002DB97A9D|nr:MULTISPECIES: molybdopterin-dependent oxidoreductase [unclassified Cocleimonas]MEB8431400.1 molybdopterin-dependent oxidoreductase [Cocleimonas sp. KMM 6892]MEC4713828.1 molybdopterin-dependent oxidoreductase [Cocleimonas sp. KMM 6895]MEC4743159.1 molybdopterin-dependent oxidoreductase [Cocleimonas sp. KMM 6896]
MNVLQTGSIKTTCPYCGVGCGVLASMDEQGVVSVKGDPDHPANYGRLCSKGTALGETAYLQDRLLYPEIKGEQVSWDQALSTISGRFSEIIDEHGADAVAFYVSGQLLTEDYYVANKLMKGFIGSANIDTNSRLCMSSAVAAYKRAFGEDCVPCSFEDLDKANLIVLTGSNAAWCHPILFQQIVRAKKANPKLKVINIDPRETQTTSAADIQLSLKPGTDAVLFNGLLNYLKELDIENNFFTENCTSGIDGALQTAKESAPSIASVAEQCALAEEDVSEFYNLFANTEKVVTVFSQGINQSSSGVDKGNAIINCHLFTGRIGRPGMGPFSFTGQPNAMGGREVGGLANQLAAHMDLENPEHCDRVQRFWNSPTIANKQGLKAVDLFEAIDQGKVKAVWIMATNPVVSMPDAEKVKAALKKCELVIVSDCVRETDTAKVADILLPALTWGENDGTVTNSDRHISRRRSFLTAPGQAKADWDIITEVAHRMGYAEHFPYASAADIFREHAALSAFENDDKANAHRFFNISELQNITNQEYETFPIKPWPITAESPAGTKRLFSNGKFNTPDGKARFISVTPRAPAFSTTKEFDLILNTGRVRDHWHTMTRTGVSPRLSAHIHEPFVEVNPLDAAQYGLTDRSLARINGPLEKSVIVRVQYSDKQQRGSIFLPIHWNGQFSSRANVGALIPSVVDPISGQPESKHGIVNIEPYVGNWHGFILSNNSTNLDLGFAKYWVKSRGRGFWRYEMAGYHCGPNWAAFSKELLGTISEDEWIEYFDKSNHTYRAAQFRGSKLINIIFIGPNEKLPPRDWLISLFQKEEISRSERISLLSGKPPADQEDAGKTVCACFNVGEKTILKAINEKELTTPEQIGECLQAGTNCGSCLPELRGILASNTFASA